MKKVRLGHLHVDCLDLAGALDAIAELVDGRQGGYVVTPNVDHVVLVESDPELRRIFENASLALVDGMPLVWMARLLGHPLPEKISGADLLRPLMARAAAKRWRVYLLGAAPGIGAQAAAILERESPGLEIVGIDAPPIGFDTNPEQSREVVERVRAATPDIVVVALGCPKQERWMSQHREAIAPAIALGLGASLDFVAGTVKRAPGWVSRAGLEWLYRLGQEPRRLAHRYLVRDRAIGRIFLRMLRMPRDERAFHG